ncbi:aromatic acid/H+ symport family MFS transporter [Chromobacterium sp. ATCC 53434]|uniref:MFS transporter n=1 Tax=Chromobacterium TaxID=535 RepID=UPI000C75A54B|nr:aromatic acid/H+ symport family MFS transporter [Chromobacterium sp. ATCC 53434]AUH50023.1 aromatic acid/H+ symport family MFS transporter [Chromobacterium sp. ATCC 53434]
MKAADLINGSGISRLQLAVLAYCLLIVTLDGFDTASVGYLASSLRAEWAMQTASMGNIFGAGLLGLMIGCFLFGPVADRIGRKRVLIASVVFFGCGSVASAFAQSPEQMAVLRLLTGLGLGGAMPNAITLSSEYSPARLRSLLVTTTFCGFTLGFAVGGWVVAWLLPIIGWRGVLLAGGLAPLMLVPLLLVYLPESLDYLLANGRRAGEALRIAKKIRPDITAIAAQDNAGPRALIPVRGLLAGDVRSGTVLLWLSYFCTLFAFYLLSSWLPLALKDSGYSIAEAARLGAMLPLGGTVGAVVIGYWMDRRNPYLVLACSYLIAATSLLLLGWSAHDPVLLHIVVFGAGLGVAGSQTGANALTACFYRSDVRATGVSWALGMGRVGSILGAMVGGVLLAALGDMSTVFGMVAIPVFLAAMLMLLMRSLQARRQAGVLEPLELGATDHR